MNENLMKKNYSKETSSIYIFSIFISTFLKVVYITQKENAKATINIYIYIYIYLQMTDVKTIKNLPFIKSLWS